MCHPTQAFKLCTCLYTKATDSYWIYRKQVPTLSTAIGEIVHQCYSIENWEELKKLAAKRLADPDVFDFDVQPDEGDMLELYFAKIHPPFEFDYRRGRWRSASPEVAFVEKKFFKKGKIKEAKEPI